MGDLIDWNKIVFRTTEDVLRELKNRTGLQDGEFRFTPVIYDPDNFVPTRVLYVKYESGNRHKLNTRFLPEKLMDAFALGGQKAADLVVEEFISEVLAEFNERAKTEQGETK